MIWRVGRKLGRTLYRQVDDETGMYEELVGFMETRELAQFVCDAVNAFGELHRQHNLEPGLVNPDDASRTVMTVNDQDRIYVVPQDDAAVPAVPPDADLPVIELDALGNDTDTRHA